MADPLSELFDSTVSTGGNVLLGTLTMGASMQSEAAEDAAQAQADAAQAAIDEQRRQFDAMRTALQPYVDAGILGLEDMQALLGLAGPDRQAAAVQGIQNSPMFQSLVQQGEQGILQNASATGGLRGGNTQAALAQFGPQMLNEFINQRYSRLGGLAQLGQGSAAGVGAAGLQTGTQIADLLGQQGAAKAGGILGQAAPWANLLNLPLQVGASYVGAGGRF